MSYDREMVRLIGIDEELFAGAYRVYQIVEEIKEIDRQLLAIRRTGAALRRRRRSA